MEVVMYPPLGPGMVWPITTPGERSDHGAPGHGLFLGSGADAQDIGNTLDQLYAVGAGGVFHQEEYTAGDGQYRGWNIYYQTDSGFTVVYAHCQEAANKSRYNEGEPIARVGEYLNNDHCHFEVDGVAAGDMPALFSITQPATQAQGDEEMSSQQIVAGLLQRGAPVSIAYVAPGETYRVQNLTGKAATIHLQYFNQSNGDALLETEKMMLPHATLFMTACGPNGDVGNFNFPVNVLITLVSGLLSSDAIGVEWAVK